MKEVEISGNLNHSIDWLQENGKRYFQAALYAGASIIVKQAKSNLNSALPASTNRNPRFNDTLQDAIRFSHTEGDVITVHTLGTRQSGSGTYRTRFFENGTRERYQKTYAGIPLKKKRYIGKLKPLGFFNSAVVSTQSLVMDEMQKVIDRMIDKADKNN